MERILAIDATFEQSRIDLNYLKSCGKDIRDFHHFRMMTHAVMKHSGYTYADDEFEIEETLEDTSDLWYRGSNKFISMFGELKNSCLFSLWVSRKTFNLSRSYTFNCRLSTLSIGVLWTFQWVNHLMGNIIIAYTVGFIKPGEKKWYLLSRSHLHDTEQFFFHRFRISWMLIA